MTTGNNQFLPFATGSSANVLTAAEYEALTALVANGFQSGIAQSQQVNTPIRQATFVAAAIAQIIANNGVNANDDGNVAEFVINLLAAIYASPILTGNPTAPNPSQFDVSTKIATTEFVNQSGFNFPAMGLGLSASQTFTASNLNNWGQFQASNLTITLPPLASVKTGSTFTFLGSIYGGTVKANGSEEIANSLAWHANTVSLSAGESLTIAADGGAWYVVADGFGNASFQSLLNTPGYLKLPNGIIIQWFQGPICSYETVYYNPLSWPFAFPNSCLMPIISTLGNDTVESDQMFQSSWTSASQIKVFPQWFGTGTQGKCYPLIVGIGY